MDSHQGARNPISLDPTKGLGGNPTPTPLYTNLSKWLGGGECQSLLGPARLESACAKFSLPWSSWDGRSRVGSVHVYVNLDTCVICLEGSYLDTSVSMGFSAFVYVLYEYIYIYKHIYIYRHIYIYTHTLVCVPCLLW